MWAVTNTEVVAVSLCCWQHGRKNVCHCRLYVMAQTSSTHYQQAAAKRSLPRCWYFVSCSATIRTLSWYFRSLHLCKRRYMLVSVISPAICPDAESVYMYVTVSPLALLLLLHPFNGFFSRTAWVNQYRKGKTSLDLNELTCWWRADCACFTNVCRCVDWVRLLWNWTSWWRSTRPAKGSFHRGSDATANLCTLRRSRKQTRWSTVSSSTVESTASAWLSSTRCRLCIWSVESTVLTVTRLILKHQELAATRTT